MALDLSSAPKSPPRSARSQMTSEANERRALRGKTAAREEAANGIFQLAGFGCIILRQYADAGAINMHGANISREVAILADQNEGIARGLDYIMEAGPYAGLIVATMPLVLQLAANHGLIKAELVAGGGVVPPAALESQVKADMARQASEALKAQQEAETELALLASQMTAPDGSESVPAANGASSGQHGKAKSQ